MKYLVTGAAGFIGSHLTKNLALEGDVIAVDNLSFGNRKIEGDRIHFVEADISQKSVIDKIFSKHKFDVVFHLAAVSGSQLSHDDPTADIRTNVLGTFLLLEAAAAQGVPKFVNTSSVAVYGSSTNWPYQEDMNLEPCSQYGVSKLATEKYAALFADKMNVTSLRLFNVYGPGQDIGNAKQGIASIYLYYIVRNEPIYTKGRLDRFRDMVYVDDVVDAYRKTVDVEGGVFNICSGIRTTVDELQKHLISAMGFDEYPVEVVDVSTPGDPFGTVGTYDKFSNASGWSPKTNVYEGIRKMTDWVKHESNSTS